MKIAYVTDAIYPFTIGGSEIRLHEIGRKLVEKGHEIHIYGGKFWSGKSIIKKDGIIIHGVSKYSKLYNARSKRKAFEPLKLSINLFFELMKEKYDIIDVQSFVFFNCYSAKLASFFNSSKIVFTWHQYFGSYLFHYLGKIKGTIAFILEYLSTLLSRNNLAVSNKIKKELIKRGIPNSNIEVIYNGADIKLAENVKKSKEKSDLIFVGRLNYQKNISLLLKALNFVKRKIPTIKLYIIGEGEQKAPLIALSKKLNLDKNVSFKGQITEKDKIYSLLKSSKIFILPSRLEGFPLTLIEANACGIPFIISKTPHSDLSEYANDNGLTFTGNEQALADKILFLLKNNSLRKKLAINAKKISKSYDWEAITKKIEAYYEELLKNGK